MRVKPYDSVGWTDHINSARLVGRLDSAQRIAVVFLVVDNKTAVFRSHLERPFLESLKAGTNRVVSALKASNPCFFEWRKLDFIAISLVVNGRGIGVGNR